MNAGAASGCQGYRSRLHTHGLNDGQYRLPAPKACGWNGGIKGRLLQGTVMKHLSQVPLLGLQVAPRSLWLQSSLFACLCV